MRQLPSRFAQVDAASAASLQRLELHVTSLQARLGAIETRLDKLRRLKVCATPERPTRRLH